MYNIFSTSLILLLLIHSVILFSQEQRNPVLEYCTGTWCVWCPCGEQVVEQIESSLPNAVILSYHGPVGSNDPFRNFPGNSIINLLTFISYPTGVVDRTSAPIINESWFDAVNNRNSIPATISINTNGSFNPVDRLLNVNINSTALQNLSGTFKMNIMILEDSLIYPQSGNSSCPGGNEYVHHNVVREMINGAEGEILVNGSNWNTGQTISKNIQYTVPANFVAEKCHLVVLVYKVQSPFYSAQIQQAKKFYLTGLTQISITVTSPNGGENILGGSNYNITWVAQNTDSVKIEYSSDSGTSWNPVINSFLNTGTFNWNVPKIASANCKIRISKTTNPLNYDVSNYLFSIYPFQFSVFTGWNLISVPILCEDMSKATLFPNSVSGAYGYNNGYIIVDTLKNAKGYWLKFNAGETISHYGNFLTQNSINVVSGWNLIGPFDQVINLNQIATQPPNLLASSFYGYGNGYYVATQFDPGKSYWIKASVNGIIQLFPTSLKDNQK